MSYQPLALKYRPATFNDLVGQTAVATALSNAIKIGREPHAVIFAGIRGIGKTTTARLYAKALMCENRSSPDPCDHCQNCNDIRKGRHVDLIEIDGASHTSVENIRSLQETLQYIPQSSHYKVYIIDEVHMLSISAFNALLKSLEEPPEHVVFIFATTELHKVPQTIVSRCQTFYLKKIPIHTTIQRLKYILEKESIPFDPPALDVIALEGQGSMRDCLTLLDQCIAFGDGAVKKEMITELFPYHSPETLIRLLTAITAKAPKQIIDVIDELDLNGAKFPKVVEELAKLARHCFLYQNIDPENLKGKVLGFSDTELKSFANIGKQSAKLDLNRIFRTLVQCGKDLDGSGLDRFIFENYLLEWCLDPGLPDLSTLPFPDLNQNPLPKPVSAPNKSLTSEFQKSYDLKVMRKKDPISKEQNEEPRPQTPPEAAEPTHPENQNPGFPETWRQFVNKWKLEKPLQARKLEEVIPLKFSPEEIVIGVDPKHLAAGQFLNVNAQTGLKSEFQEVFGFNGQLVIKNISAETNEAQSSDESILAIKQREKAVQDQKDIENAKSAPIVQEFMKKFDAEISNIEVLDQT